MTPYTITRVELDPVTIAELDDLDHRCFPEDDLYDKPGAVWWLTRHTRTGRVVGFCGAKYWAPDRAVFLCRAGVLPEARGRGLQRRMIRTRVRYAQELEGCAGVYTYTSLDNHASANNLIACGFRMFSPSRPWGGELANYWWRRIEA